jgi:malonyl CoA-acyl carrier protein transacylase
MKRAFRHFTSKSADINISKKIALLFPGQGAQQVGMGKDIYENFKIAKETIEECEQALGLRLKNIMVNYLVIYR